MSEITLAASAKAFQALFNVIEMNFSIPKSDSRSFGPFTASYSVNVTLSGGTLQLNNNNTFELSDVDVVFSTLDFKLCLDLPGFAYRAFVSCRIPGTVVW